MYHKRKYVRKSLKPITERKALTKASLYDAEKIARKVTKRALMKNIETKHIDGALTANPDWTGSVYNMIADPSGATTITQGVGPSQYIGEKLRVSSINLRYQWIYADTTNTVRCVIIQAKGLLIPATMADILQSVANLRAPLSDFDTDFDQRYSLLYDSGPIALTSTMPQEVTRTIHLPGKYIRTTSFSDAAGTCEDGDIFLGIVSDSGAVTNPAFNGYWRLNYKDA